MIEILERRALFAVTVDDTFPVVDALPADDTSVSSIPAFMDVLSDGRIVTGGLIDPQGTAHFRVARFTVGGALDTTFGGGDGLSPLVGSIPDAPLVFPSVDGVAQGDGKIVLATASQSGFAVARFNADGTADTSFGGDGFVTVEGLTNADSPLGNPAIAITTDGDIVLTGSKDFDTFFHIARLNADGTSDTSFGSGGHVTLFGADIFDFQGAGISPVTTRDIAAVAGGKVLVLLHIHGTGNFAGNVRPALVQLEADGDLDPTFSGDGMLPFEFTVDGNPDEVGAMLVEEFDGGIIVVGSDQVHTAITRFNANGTRDSGFGTGFADVSTQREPYHLTIDNNADFVVAVSQAITRFTAVGNPDVSFAPGGTDNAGLATTAIDFDEENRALIISGGELQRLILDAEDRPDVALGVNGTLIVTGESGTADNTITIALSADDIVVTRNGVATNFDADDVADIDIVTFDGDDTITVSVDRPVHLIAGDGTNEITLADGGSTSIRGGDGADHITAGDGNQNIACGGDDSVTLGDGATIILCGEGNDTVTTGSGTDQIFGEGGSDSISSGGGDDTVFGGVDTNDLRAISGGADGDNVIDGGSGDDLLVGADGRDTIRGGAQKDRIIGFNHSELLIGGGGRDKIAGGGGRDRIHGGAGDDQLDGGDGDDRVAGGNGDDKIFGGAGLDLLNGDDGGDLFFAQDNAIDQIDGGTGDNTASEFDEDDDIVNAVEGA